MDKAGAAITDFLKRGDILEDILDVIANIIIGMITTLIAYALLNTLNLNEVIIVLLEIKYFSATTLFYIFLLTFFYIFGLLTTTFFNFYIAALGELSAMLNKSKLAKVGRFKGAITHFYNYFYTFSLLDARTSSLSGPYKTFLRKKLFEYFKVKGQPKDIVRLSRRLCIEKNLVKKHKFSYFGRLFKGLLIDFLLLSLWFGFNRNYGLSTLLLLFAWWILGGLREDINILNTMYLDATYLYFLEESQKK